MPAIPDCCKTCIWWKMLEDDNTRGECRRYAPSPQEFQKERKAEFPITPEYDLCGDYKKI